MTRHEYREEYLNSEEWKKIRALFLNQKDGNCEKCGNPGNDVHHTAYLFNQNYSLQKQHLMLLCRKCHNLVHSALNCGLIKIPHDKSVVINLTKEQVSKKCSNNKKKHLVSMMLISDIVKNNTSHGIKMACGVLKITSQTFCSIPPNLKATYDQINKLQWIAKTKPTRDGWKSKVLKK